MVIITGMAVVGCGSKQETSASAGELTRETTIEEETTIKTGKKPQKQIETSVKETETTKGKEITETTEEKTTQKENPTVGGKADQPQEPATVLEKNQPEASTQEPQPQPEIPTPAPEPVTEAPTQPQKTQAEYLEEFKQNYSKLRKSLYGDTAAGNPQWSDTLYRIAKLRADEIVGYNFGHTSPNGYRNGYNTLECITQDPAYRYAWEGWCESPSHYEILCNQRMDMYAVAVGEGGCVFLTASSKDWTGEAYADAQTAINENEAKTAAINDYGATEQNWKEVLENEVLWWICKDENGNERFDITYDVYIQEYWQSCFDWYTQHYGEKVIK